MPFHTEPNGYFKTALSELQGAWQNLRETVVKLHPFPNSDRILFHIDEGMSWESVRNLDNMKKTLLLIRNIALQAKSSEEIIECLEIIDDTFDEVIEALRIGEIK